VIRAFLVCDDIIYMEGRRKQVSLINLISYFTAERSGAYPWNAPEFCVFAQATACRVEGRIWVDIIEADTSAVVHCMPTRVLPAKPDPLAIVGVRWRIRDCTFPKPGLYWVRLWYNNHCLAEHSLVLR
jgi:hypothetical protein